MDLEFLIIIAFIGIGLCLRAIFGLNLMVLLMSLSLVMVIFSVFLIPRPGEYEINQAFTDTAVIYFANLKGWLLPMFIGALGGIYAREIVSLPKVIIDFARGRF